MSTRTVTGILAQAEAAVEQHVTFVFQAAADELDRHMVEHAGRPEHYQPGRCRHCPRMDELTPEQRIAHATRKLHFGRGIPDGD